MAKLTLLCVGTAIVLTSVLQLTAAETVVFNLEKKIEDYAQRLAQHYKTKVVWWDTHGEKLFHPKERYSFIGVGFAGPLGHAMVANQLKRYKLDVKTGPVQYGNVSTTKNTTTVLHTEWIEASAGPVKTTFKKSKEHKRKSSWNLSRSIRSGFELSLSSGLPKFLAGSAKYHTEVNVTNSVGGEYAESEKFSVQQQITTPPGTSAQIEWIVVDEVKEVPWSADVTIQGWFAVCLDKQINGKYVLFPAISALQDPLLKKINDRTVRFTVTGVFTGVKTIGNKLKVTKYDAEAYSRRPLSTTVNDLPLH